MNPLCTVEMEEKPSKNKSKSARKREASELQKLGDALARLNDEQLADVPLGPELRQALADYRRLKSREARRRQMQYVGRLMRSGDPAPIRAALEDLDRSSAQARYAHSTAERWRTSLIASDDALTDYIAHHPDTDRVVLRNLIREARRQPDRPARELFRHIHADVRRTHTNDPDATAPD